MKNISKILLFVVILFFVSCSSKVNKDNYNRISDGMSVSRVESILGKGKSEASSSLDLGEYGGTINSQVLTWERGTKIIIITFSNGAVIGKAQRGL